MRDDGYGFLSSFHNLPNGCDTAATKPALVPPLDNVSTGVTPKDRIPLKPIKMQYAIVH